MLAVIQFGGVELAGGERHGGGAAPDAVAVIAVTLLTSTFQAAGEEYFFRGYLLQAVGALVRSSMVAILVTTVLFTMAHGVWPWQSPALFLDRFAFGLVAGLLVVRTGGLEASIAAHAANNVVTFVFAALTNSVGASLGVQDAPWSLVTVDVVKFVAFGAVALWLARRMKLATVCELPLTAGAGRPARGWCDGSDNPPEGTSFWCPGPCSGTLFEPGCEGGDELTTAVKCLWGMG